jgi:ketosteroid isomerase-like protein
MEAFINSVGEGNREKMADFFAPDVVIEMPFQPGAERAEGRETIRARMIEAKDRWLLDRVEDVTLHETADPEVIVAEYSVHGRVAANQNAFVAGFVTVTRIRDGLIVHSRDYNNPTAVAAAMEMTPEQVSASLQED